MERLGSHVHSNRRELGRFLKFSVVGTIGAAVDFGILFLLHVVLHVHIVVANTCSFTAAVVSNFIWNRYWTYPDSRSKPLRRQLVQFFVVNVAGWLINTAILLLLRYPFASLVDGVANQFSLGGDADFAYKVGYNLAKALATGIVLFWNFFVNRYWTYSDVGAWGEWAAPQESN